MKPTNFMLLVSIHVVHSHLRVIANPSPLGLFSFASTTLMLSLVNVQARHVTEVRISPRAQLPDIARLSVLN